MTVSTFAAIVVAILLWSSGYLVGTFVAVLLTMLYFYRKGQQFIAERDAEEWEQ